MLAFSYVYQNTQGRIYAESVAQAIDRIEVAYLAKQGIRPTNPKFRLMKKQLPRPWRLNLAPETNIRFRTVYRNKKDGEPLSPTDLDFFLKYSRAAQDLKTVCPSHLRPIGAPA